jgi:carbon-monoxide dehydrogenase catalytic subunit
MLDMNIPIRPGVHQTLVETAKAKGVETGRERLAAMRPQCGFGELGTCCRMCYMGPCRIDPFGNGPKTGICGVSPDTMVARNLLRETIGASSHVGHARHLLLTLRDAEREAPGSRRGQGLAVAKRFDVPTEGGPPEVCLDLVDIALRILAARTASSTTG